MANSPEQPSVRDIISQSMEESGAEARTDLAADETASIEGDLSAENLRSYLTESGIPAEDLAGMTDEQLLQAYKAAEKPEAGAATTAEEKAWDRHWKFLTKDGKDVSPEDLKTLRRVLEHQIQYKAGGKEVPHTLDQLIRLAQRTGPAEQRTQYLVDQRNRAFDRATEAEAKVKQAEADKQTWMEALLDVTGGKFLKLQTSFLNSGGKVPESAAPTAQGYTPEQEAQGELVYQREIVPSLAQIARSFGYNGAAPTEATSQHLFSQLDKVFRDLVAKEGAYFANDAQYRAARINEILTHDLPHLAMNSGWGPVGQVAPAASAPTTPATPAIPAAAVPNDELAKLKAEVQNLRLAALKRKVSGAPDSGTGASVASTAGIPTLDKKTSWRQMRDALRDPNEHFGLDS